MRLEVCDLSLLPLRRQVQLLQLGLVLLHLVEGLLLLPLFLLEELLDGHVLALEVNVCGILFSQRQYLLPVGLCFLLEPTDLLL